MQDRITKLILIFMFLVTTSMSCEKEEIEPDRHFRIGEEYTITPDLSFTIDNISDSRCPEGAVCIWEGDVLMDFHIKVGNGVIDTTMNLNYHRNKPSEFGGLRFEIKDVIPYPILGEEINQKDVRVVMQMVKQ